MGHVAAGTASRSAEREMEKLKEEEEVLDSASGQTKRTRVNYTFGYLCINTLAVGGTAKGSTGSRGAGERGEGKSKEGTAAMGELLFCVRAKV